MPEGLNCQTSFALFRLCQLATKGCNFCFMTVCEFVPFDKVGGRQHRLGPLVTPLRTISNDNIYVDELVLYELASDLEKQALIVRTGLQFQHVQ